MNRAIFLAGSIVTWALAGAAQAQAPADRDAVPALIPARRPL